MKEAFFITGTDSGVGKTLVATALLTAANRAGLATAAIKPVAAGCMATAKGLRNEDALLLQQASSLALSYEQVNPVALAPAIAPHIAAAEAGQALDLGVLVAACRDVLGLTANFWVVEGAGGWRVPLDSAHTFADLAAALGLPVILVVGMRLGCINQAVLTAEAIINDGLSLAGWVANSIDPPMTRYQENLTALQTRLPCPLLGEIPHLAPRDFFRAADFLTASLLWRQNEESSGEI